jgi:hypothetical protein
MASQDDFHLYASECLESAMSATDYIARKRFLELAKLWMTAAQQLDDGMSVPLAPKDTHNDNQH